MLFITFENYWNEKNHCTMKTNFYLFAMIPLTEGYTGPNRGTLLESLFCIFKTSKAWAALVAAMWQTKRVP